MEAQLLENNWKFRGELSEEAPRVENAQDNLDTKLNLEVPGLVLNNPPHVVDAIEKVPSTPWILLIAAAELRTCTFDMIKYLHLTLYDKK